MRVPAPVGSAPAGLRLYALSGQVVWEQTLPSGALEVQADLGALPPGVYFMRYEREDGAPLGVKVVKI
ncbi:MAG: T9SS type A sorting domain-containing protein [Saprospiraceae bacterium]|nr:T9SS type A sorting domain-containing protein [Saprospiraceae bacterium]